MRLSAKNWDCWTKIETVRENLRTHSSPSQPCTSLQPPGWRKADKKVGVWKHKLARLQNFTRPWPNIGPKIFFYTRMSSSVARSGCVALLKCDPTCMQLALASPLLLKECRVKKVTRITHRGLAGDRGGWAGLEIFQGEWGGVNEEASLSWTVRPSVISTGPDKQATIHCRSMGRLESVTLANALSFHSDHQSPVTTLSTT